MQNTLKQVLYQVSIKLKLIWVKTGRNDCFETTVASPILNRKLHTDVYLCQACNVTKASHLRKKLK